jgi:Mg-chelatase subunit ChlD
MHPTVPGLAHPPTQDAILRSLFELTSQIETIKKALARLETRDGSPLR